MTAAIIVSRKQTGTVTVKSEATVAEAIDLLSRHNIGALIVSDDEDTVAGILSERDVIHGLSRSGPSLLEHRVGDVMTRDVRTCTPAESTRNMLGLMTELRVRHLPVMDDGRLVGIVSIGDVVKLRLDNLIAEAEAMQNYISEG